MVLFSATTSICLREDFSLGLKRNGGEKKIIFRACSVSYKILEMEGNLSTKLLNVATEIEASDRFVQLFPNLPPS